LFVASQNGHVAVVESLVAKGADLNAKRINGKSVEEIDAAIRCFFSFFVLALLSDFTVFFFLYFPHEVKGVHSIVDSSFLL